jgi:hypothetical protein
VLISGVISVSCFISSGVCGSLVLDGSIILHFPYFVLSHVPGFTWINGDLCQLFWLVLIYACLILAGWFNVVYFSSFRSKYCQINVPGKFK